MAPPLQLVTETSTFETINQIDTDASESAKLLRLAQGYKSKAIELSKVVNINIYGYLTGETQTNSALEKKERGEMQTRFATIRNKLIRMGVPNEKIWVGGVASSTKFGGQIDVSVKEIDLNTIILPPYTPAIPSKDPQKPSGAKEQWLDADGSVKKDVLEGVLALEIELTFKEGGIFKTKPPVSVKASVNEKGEVKLGAEWTALEEEIKKKAFWGAIQEVKFKVSAEAEVGVQIDKSQIHTEINAALKASLSAVLIIPKTSIKIPVEVSIGVGINGEIVPGIQTTYKW